MKVWVPPNGAGPDVNVKIVRQVSFGSAGSNVTSDIGVACGGAEIEQAKIWDVTYKVTSGKDLQNRHAAATRQQHAERFQVGDPERN